MYTLEACFHNHNVMSTHMFKSSNTLYWVIAYANSWICWTCWTCWHNVHIKALSYAETKLQRMFYGSFGWKNIECIYYHINSLPLISSHKELRDIHSLFFFQLKYGVSLTLSSRVVHNQLCGWKCQVCKKTSISMYYWWWSIFYKYWSEHFRIWRPYAHW